MKILNAIKLSALCAILTTAAAWAPAQAQAQYGASQYGSSQPSYHTDTKVVHSHKTGSRVIGSIYAVEGQVTVKGWEHDLVKHNPGLSQFNWSPITAAKPGRVVFRRPTAQDGVKEFHYVKPQVVDTNAILQQQQAREKATASVSASLAARQTNSSVAATYSYSTNNCDAYLRAPVYSSSKASYSSGSSRRATGVHGRLISVK